YLTSALKARLLPMGYTAESQQSLQIRRFGEPAGKPESDVTVYDSDVFRARKPYASPGDMGLPAELVLNMPEAASNVEEIEQYRAIAIYSYEVGKPDRGEPVAWLELLSPSNKPGGQDAAYYRNKRWKILHSGIIFVELDYLHESPPTFDGIPSYAPFGRPRVSDPGAHPYHVVVADPRPIFDEGKVYPHEFDVDREIPTVTIPLNGSDTLKFDFNEPYKKTFTEMLYGLEWVDYSQLPLNFDRYSGDDQVRILARMLYVLDAARQKVDLEQIEVLPTEPIPLNDALRYLKSWE
ncbi:MAG: DUF4058 family protein, partial [Anaerolineae bacterium]|nr:DUF4058 family protein [Anaerolineae bacterium]